MYKSNVSKKKEKKDTYYPHYIPQKVSTLPLTKWSYTNSPPKMDCSHTKTTPPFCHEWQRIRVSTRHLIDRANIIRSISIIIILILRSRSHRRRWWRSSLKSKATHRRLSSCNTIDTTVHLIQLCRECIEAVAAPWYLLEIHRPKKKEEPMWMEPNKMEWNERKELLNSTTATEAGPCYV